MKRGGALSRSAKVECCDVVYSKGIALSCGARYSIVRSCKAKVKQGLVPWRTVVQGCGIVMSCTAKVTHGVAVRCLV